MSKIDIIGRRTNYKSGRVKEEFYLLSPKCNTMLLGYRIPLGSRKNLITLRDKINERLEREYE